MRIHKCLSVLLIVIAASSSGATADELYKKILSTGGLHDKEALGRTLGEMRTPEARAALMKLMDESSYWNRLAAVAGLASYRDTEVMHLLADRLVNDFMIADAILPQIKKEPDVFAPMLIGQCRKMNDDMKRRSLITHIAALKSASASNYISMMVQDAADANRTDALRELIKNYPAEIRTARTLAEDAKLGDTALSIILQNGGTNDLPIFLAAYANRSRTSAAKILSCQAVMCWGDDALKVRIMQSALQSSDSALVGGALLGIKGFPNAALYPELCRLARAGETSGIRLLAAEDICDYESTEAVPYLISALKEEYAESRAPLAVDVFVSAVTLGITSIFDKINASASRSEFSARKERIAQALRRKTGQNLSGYKAWREWAVLRGMTVDGGNLMQFLWSADRELRDRAAGAAIRYLGFADRDAFLRTLPKGAGESELRLELARQLEKRGVLKDEN